MCQPTNFFYFSNRRQGGRAETASAAPKGATTEPTQAHTSSKGNTDPNDRGRSNKAAAQSNRREEGHPQEPQSSKTICPITTAVEQEGRTKAC